MTLNQRYISDTLYHFVGFNHREDIDKQYQVLKTVLSDCWISHAPHIKQKKVGFSIHYFENIENMYQASCTCYADIPLSDLEFHMRRYGRTGIGFDKKYLVEQGANPVYYVIKNQESLKGQEEKATYFKKMIHYKKRLFLMFKNHLIESNLEDEGKKDWERLDELDRFLNAEFFCMAKFFDFKDSYHDDDFYFEREWRILGNLNFEFAKVKRVILPKEKMPIFKMDFPDYQGEIIFS